MKPRRDSGFSLVEITLALGIVAVALVTTMGLLGTGLNSQRLSAEDTTLAAMSEQVLGELRAADFDTLWDKVPGIATSKTKPAKPTAVPELTTYYFSQEGRRVEAKSDLAFYECAVTKKPDPSRQSVDPVTQVPGLGRHNLLMLELKFSAPVSVPSAQRPSQRSLHANIARY